MALEDILGKISKDAESEVKEILKQAESEASSIIAGAEQEAGRVEKEMMEKGNEKAEKEKGRIVISALLEQKKDILAEKQKIIDAVYEQVKSRIGQLGDKKYMDLARKIIIESCETGEEEVIVGEKDKKRIDKKFIDSINKELAKKGRKGKITLSKDKAQVPDGFIFRQGKTEVDSSWDSIIRALRERTVDEVAKILYR